jgi:hypothetical protein
MKKTNGKKIKQEILFYTNKLPPIKQIEALDFIKWLWGGPGSREEFTAEELNKIESLAKKKGGRKFKNWESAKKYLEGLMR